MDPRVRYTTQSSVYENLALDFRQPRLPKKTSHVERPRVSKQARIIAELEGLLHNPRRKEGGS